MYENLRKKVDELFQNAPKTSRSKELKEEVLANLIDKYNDLISSGANEEDAIKIAIAGVGDVNDLIRGLGRNDIINYEEMKKDKQKSALLLSISIGLYIMSIVVLILLAAVFDVRGEIAVSAMFTIDALATGLIVYNATSRTKYIKSEDSIVENFKELKSMHTEKDNILKSIKSIVWTIIVAIYLIISFVFDLWAYSWIIFIIGAAVEKIITLSFQLKE
ncbi:MAG: permease prefix domain 1-containing protein [Clostridium sp.]